MAFRDDEQFLLDEINEGSHQYWVDEKGNEDPNQYLNEERNEEVDEEGNKHEQRDNQSNVGSKRVRGQCGLARKVEGIHIITVVKANDEPVAPEDATRKFVSHNSWVARDHVLISIQSKTMSHAMWKKHSFKIQRRSCCGPPCSRSARSLM